MKEEFKHRLLRRFVDEPERMSRNRNFHAYLDPRVRRAARVGRILRSLRADLQGRVVAGARLVRDSNPVGPGNYVLELRFDNGVRRTHLDRLELELLLEDEDVHARLRELLDEELAA